MKDKCKYAIENFTDYELDDDFEFAYCTLDFLSTRDNSHKHVYSDSVLREYGDSVLGKWVVAEYDYWDDDVTTHTGDNMQIIGVVPKNQEVQYRVTEDGYTVASVNAVLSKLYATNIYEVLRKSHQKNISVETLVNFTPETADYIDGRRPKVVEAFNICAITVLGDEFKPSCPDANLVMTQMSEDSIEHIEKEYDKYSHLKLKDSTFMQEVLDKLDDISKKLNKEDNMPNNEEKEVVALESIETLDETNDVEMTEEVAENDCGKDEEEKLESPNEPIEEKEETDRTDDKEEEKMSDVEEEESEEVDDVDYEALYTELLAKNESLKKEIAEKDETIKTYSTELEELKAFKLSAEEEKKNEIIVSTLEEIKEFISDEEFNQFSKIGKECAYAHIENWKNETLSKITARVLAKMSKINDVEKGIFEIDIPSTNVERKTSIYD